jgi:hypothetical protein
MLTKEQWIANLSTINQSVELYPAEKELIILNQPTGDFFYDPWVLKEEYKNTVWEELLSSLPYAAGEARVIRLLPGESYMAHADIDDRWHLNLTGDYCYLIDLNENTMYQLVKDGHWYSMDAGKIHVASNFGSIYRYQLVVRMPLLATKEKKLTSVSIEPASEQKDYRYKFDNIISPYLNKINKEFKMKDFKFQGQVVSFKLATSELKNLKSLINNDFKVTYA